MKYVTISKFSELSGYTEHAIRTKIRDGVWLQNKVWVQAPDGKPLMNIEGYELWVEMGMGSGRRQALAMKSPLPIKGRAAANESNSSPAPLTVSA